MVGFKSFSLIEVNVVFIVLVLCCTKCEFLNNEFNLFASCLIDNKLNL